MKRNVLIVLLLLLCWTAKGQDIYTVQQIKGNIIRNGVAVKVGDKIASTDMVKFSTGSVMMVSSSNYGKQILSPNPQVYSSETARSLIDYLPKSNRASSKSNQLLSSVLDFNNYFGTTKFRIYGKETAFEVPTAFVTLNEKNFPFLRFKHPSEAEPVNKKLSVQGQKVLLRQDEIFKINGQPIEAKDCVFEGMFFYEEGKAEFNKVMGCQLIFVDDAPLQEYASNFVSLIDKNQIDTQLYNSLYNTLSDFALIKYGEADKDNLEYWIQNTLGISRPNK